MTRTLWTVLLWTIVLAMFAAVAVASLQAGIPIEYTSMSPYFVSIR